MTSTPAIKQAWDLMAREADTDEPITTSQGDPLVLTLCECGTYTINALRGRMFHPIAARTVDGIMIGDASDATIN